MMIKEEVPESEMREKFPEMMKALDNPRDAFYCFHCDGLRLKDHQCVKDIK